MTKSKYNFQDLRVGGFVEHKFTERELNYQYVGGKTLYKAKADSMRNCAVASAERRGQRRKFVQSSFYNKAGELVGVRIIRAS